MRKIDYDAKDKATGGTETHEAVDEAMAEGYSSGNVKRRLVEGFASADGVRGVTAASGGRVKHPEKSDSSHPDRVPETIEDENPGLADD